MMLPFFSDEETGSGENVPQIIWAIEMRSKLRFVSLQILCCLDLVLFLMDLANCMDHILMKQYSGLLCGALFIFLS